MASPRRTTKRPDTKGIHICAECASELVQPVEWFERDRNSWAVELRCPECEWRGGGVFDQAEVDDYDRRLDEGCRAIHNDLEKLTRENMEADVEAFSEALWAERILPEDF